MYKDKKPYKILKSIGWVPCASTLCTVRLLQDDQQEGTKNRINLTIWNEI